MEAEGVMLTRRLPDPWPVSCVSSVPLADAETWSVLYSMPQFASLHTLPSESPQALLQMQGPAAFPSEAGRTQRLRDGPGTHSTAW